MNTKTIKINFFENYKYINIFDYDYYKNNNIFNNEGLDIISKCIDRDNCWEPFQTEITKELLKNGNNIFIDIGCHLGYYSLLASSYNNKVISIDINDIYLDLFSKSIQLNKIENIELHKKYVDNNFSIDSIVDINSYIKLIKCDIEGFEIEFIDSIFDRIKEHKIENLIIEISPQFRDNYPEYILKIKNLGYFIYDIGLSPQRKLNNATKLSSLKEKIINIDDLEDMEKYINSFPEKQSNFLCSLIDYN